MPAHHKIHPYAVLAVTMLLGIALGACSVEDPDDPSAEVVTDTAKDEQISKTEETGVGNSLLSEWTGPFETVPAFDRMNLEDLVPAMEAGMAEELAEVEAIASNPEPPTFENTIEAMEDKGRTLDRVLEYWGIWGSNLSTPEFQTIQEEMSPRLADFRTRIIQNAALFERIRSVYASDEMESLRPDQQRLVQLIYDDFVRKGAALSGEAKQRYAAIAQQLAVLRTQFSNNVLADEEGYVVFLDENQISGIPGLRNWLARHHRLI